MPTSCKSGTKVKSKGGLCVVCNFFIFSCGIVKRKKKKKKKKDEKEEKEKEKEEASWGDKGGRGVQVRFVFWNLLSLYILYRTQINKIVTLYIYILIYLHCTSIPPCVDVCVTTYGIVFLWSQHNVKSKKIKKKLKKKKFKIKIKNQKSKSVDKMNKVQINVQHSKIYKSHLGL